MIVLYRSSKRMRTAVNNNDDVDTVSDDVNRFNVLLRSLTNTRVVGIRPQVSDVANVSTVSEDISRTLHSKWG